LDLKAKTERDNLSLLLSS
jgi:hypothetical protein